MSPAQRRALRAFLIGLGRALEAQEKPPRRPRPVGSRGRAAPRGVRREAAPAPAPRPHVTELPWPSAPATASFVCGERCSRVEHAPDCFFFSPASAEGVVA